MNQGGNPSAGFTIVETLIVLAVTAGLLASSLILISGRQAKTQFQTSVNGMQQDLQETIGEVQKGYYPNPNDGSFSCNSSLAQVSYGPGAARQGENSGCIFLGKVLKYSTAAHSYAIVPVGGFQFTSGSVANPVTDLTQGKPVAAQGLAQSQSFGGVDFVKAFYDGIVANSITSFGIFSGDDTGSFASTTVSGLGSGSEPFSLYAVTSLPCGASPPFSTTLYRYPNNVAGSNSCIKNVSSVSVCVTGGSNSSALITIGANGGLDVSKQVYSGSTC